MPSSLRRVLNHLPLPGGGRVQYVKSSWHKPTPFDQWRSQPPFRPINTLRADHFGRSLRRRRLGRAALKWAIAFAVAWVVVESVRAVTLF
jgi:hypothetical protein